jgi:hypothetical protein
MQKVLIGKVSRFMFLILLERKIKKGFLKVKNYEAALFGQKRLKGFMRSMYFASVVSIASEYFPQLPFQSSVLHATRLADKNAFFKKILIVVK